MYATNPRFFQICTDSKFTTGAAVSATPTSAFGTYKSCTTSTPWKLVSVVVLAKNETEPFPGTSQVVDRATTRCPPSDKKRHFEVPSQSVWSSNGITGASCWVDDPSQ